MAGSEHLVGRHGTLTALRSRLARARDGAGGVVLVVGDAGIGKTAVLRSLTDEAATAGMSVAWGQCWDDALAPAFWPWTQVLGEEPDDAAASRFELFEAVRVRLVERGEPAGVLVVLDDLHWADEASLLLLGFLARHVGRARVLIVGAVRDVDVPPALDRVAASSEVVALAPLVEADARRLAQALAGDAASADALDAVVRRSGGNPLFVRELVRLLTAGGGTTGPDVAALGSLREIVGERVARLSPACRHLLDVAALLGADLRLDVLGRVAPDAAADGADLADLLAEAAQARILVVPDDGAPAFAHDVFREVLVSTIDRGTRARLHLRIARALEEASAAGVAVDHAVLAAHFVAATSLGVRSAAADACQHSRRAAADALARLAFEDAVAHLRRADAALDAAEHPDPAARIDVALAAGVALDRSGDVHAARRAFLAAAEGARALGDAERLADAAVGVHRLGALSGLSRTGNVELLEEAARALGGRRSRRAARVLASLARELHHTWDPGVDDRARAAATEAVAIARELDDAPTLAFCLLASHDARWSVGSAPQRLPVLTEMLDVAASTGDRESYAQARLLRAAALLEIGDPSAPHELERACRAADDLGHARGRWCAMSRRAVVALLAGDLDEALRLAEEAARLGERIGEPDTLGVRDTVRWEVARFRGGWADFVTEAHWVPPGSWPPLRAVLLVARGDRGAAAAALAGYSLEHDRRHGIRRHDGWMPMVVAEAVMAAGTDAQREAVYEWLRPLAGRHLVYGGAMGYGGAVDHYLGQLAAALGRDVDATSHLRAALGAHETLGAVAWAALDRVLLDGDAPVRPAPSPAPGPNVLRREGATWRLTFRGRTCTVRHVKGMLDLAVLLARPHREVPALELMGGLDVGGPAGVVLDDQARRAYQARIGELQGEIDDAHAANDWARADRAERELDALVEQLGQAFGLGGRQRATGGSAERARAAVTHRVRGAIRRIGEADPELGRHLVNAVKTGAWCAYRPDGDVEWSVAVDG